MANAAPLPTTSVRDHRSRPGAIVALLVFAAIVTIGVFGLDWSESPAMMLGELIGLIAPLAILGAAGLLIYAFWRRMSAD